jgi:hypothetical protein
MSEDVRALADVFAEALGKYREGAKKYGRFDPATDPRNLLAEAEAELLDCINYLGMFLLQVRAMKRGGGYHG